MGSVPESAVSAMRSERSRVSDATRVDASVPETRECWRWRSWSGVPTTSGMCPSARVCEKSRRSSAPSSPSSVGIAPEMSVEPKLTVAVATTFDSGWYGWTRRRSPPPISPSSDGAVPLSVLYCSESSRTLRSRPTSVGTVPDSSLCARSTMVRLRRL